MVRLYADECANGIVIRALRDRGIDVVTAQEDGRSGDPDPQVLDRATEPDRVLFTHDGDHLIEAARRQRAQLRFTGVVFAHPDEVPVLVCIENLELSASAGNPEEFQDRGYYLPI